MKVEQKAFSLARLLRGKPCEVVVSTPNKKSTIRHATVLIQFKKDMPDPKDVSFLDRDFYVQIGLEFVDLFEAPARIYLQIKNHNITYKKDDNINQSYSMDM